MVLHYACGALPGQAKLANDEYGLIKYNRELLHFGFCKT